MALQTFRSLTFRAVTFAAGDFSGFRLQPRLYSFRAAAFAVGTLDPGTFGNADGGNPAGSVQGMMTPDQLAPQPVDTNCTPALTVTLDFSGDPGVWDNTSTLSYLSVRNAGDVLACPTGCHRHAVTLKEQAASNGVYDSNDIVVRIPRASLAPIVPKPRDRFTDEDSVVWTVLEVGTIALKNRYRLVCRDLVLAHDLRDAIDVQRAALTFDVAGVRVKTWSTLYTGVPARLQPITAEISEERGVRGLKVTHECIVGRSLEDVTNEDRVLLAGVFYEVRGFSMPERIDELMRLSLEKVP